MSGQGIIADSHEAIWSVDPGDTWADALVAAMKVGGVDNLFFVSGSELTFFQEAIAKAQARGRPAPALRTVTNEHVALNIALGNAMARNLPAATTVHVDVGTLHYGAAVHTAWRGGYPVLMTAGTGPRASAGAPGGRFETVHWFQEPRDQAGIVRQYTKADHRLEHQDDPALMVRRLLQLAMSEPRGPVYLAIPMEAALLPLDRSATVPVMPPPGAATEPHPDPDAVARLARWLLDAESPTISTAWLGRDPSVVVELEDLVELLAIAVTEPGHASRMNFPSDHWASVPASALHSSDVVLIVDNDVPFVPDPSWRPAKLAWAGVDPVQQRMKTMEFEADLRITTSAGPLIRALVAQVTPLLTPPVRRRIEARRQRPEKQHRATRQRRAAALVAARKSGRLTGAVVVDAVAAHLDHRSVVVNDGVSNAVAVRHHAGRHEPGTYYRSGGSAGGWGAGAAVGIKLADPSREVVHFTGDGYYLFGCPTASLLASADYAAPTLTVVLVNGSYSTGTSALERAYPDGYAVRRGDFAGGTIAPEPDYVALARAGGGHGELAGSANALQPALERAFAAVRDGQAALVAARVDGPVSPDAR